MDKLMELLKKMDRASAHKAVDSVYDIYELAQKFGLIGLVDENTQK